jgi:hypothetical protein
MIVELFAFSVSVTKIDRECFLFKIDVYENIEVFIIIDETLQCFVDFIDAKRLID